MAVENLPTFASVCYGHVSLKSKPKAEWISNSVQFVFLGSISDHGILQTFETITSWTAIFKEEKKLKGLPNHAPEYITLKCKMKLCFRETDTSIWTMET